MKKIDLIVHTRHLYTLQGDGSGYRHDHSIAVDAGKILAVEPTAEIDGAYTAERVIDAWDKLALPGFIDGHMHASLCALRGLAQDVGNWMMHGLGPFEDASTPRTKDAGTRLGIAEAILNGTTTIGEDGKNADAACRFIKQAGVRGNISVRIRDAIARIYEPGELYEFNDELGRKSLEETLGVYNTWHGADGGRIRVLFGPQGADFVSEPMLLKVRQLAKERGTRVHMHLQQGSRETRQMEMRYGTRTIPWLDSRGYFDQDFIGIHLTDALDDEVRLVASRGAGMVLCSGSIGIIDGIVPPAKVFQDAGGPVALGSDQAPGNNCHNVINEMKLTALFNKIKYEDPEVMPCWKVLRMATIEGAKAIGVDDVTGSIEPGKDADIVLIDLHTPAMSPVYAEPMRNLICNLVYSATNKEVDTVIAGGRVIVEGGKPLTFDLEEILSEAGREADKVAAGASEKFWQINGVNAVYAREGKL